MNVSYYKCIRIERRSCFKDLKCVLTIGNLNIVLHSWMNHLLPGWRIWLLLVAQTSPFTVISPLMPLTSWHALFSTMYRPTRILAPRFPEESCWKVPATYVPHPRPCQTGNWLVCCMRSRSATDFGAAEKWLCKFIYAWHALLQQNHISC